MSLQSNISPSPRAQLINIVPALLRPRPNEIDSRNQPYKSRRRGLMCPQRNQLTDAPSAAESFKKQRDRNVYHFYGATAISF